MNYNKCFVYILVGHWPNGNIFTQRCYLSKTMAAAKQKEFKNKYPNNDWIEDVIKCDLKDRDFYIKEGTKKAKKAFIV